MQRNDKLLRELAEEAAREPCQRRSTAPRDCPDLPGYSHTLWCLPCKARETLQKVNAPLGLDAAIEEAKIRSVDQANQNTLEVMREAEDRSGLCADPACPVEPKPHNAHGGRIS